MSSTTMMPRIGRVSGLPMRPRSTRIFVTIADEEMPRTPARTSASDVPQPSAKPKARPAPTFRARYVPPAMAIFRPPVLRSSMWNSSPR